MNGISILFLLVNGLLLLTLPRRWAPLPLLVGSCYMTLGQGFNVGPFSFNVIRVLVAVGVVRVLARGERLAGGLNTLDKIMVAWGVWAISVSVFYPQPFKKFVGQAGVVYNIEGIYFLIRIFCRDLDDLKGLIKLTAILLLPVGLIMILEQASGRNMFSVLGAVPEAAVVRDGRVRASGPFRISILAGTVGAVCIPLMIGIWRQNRNVAIMGITACLLMVVASSSSGPIMSTMFGLFALGLWRWRQYTKQMRWAALFAYVALDLVMKPPAYFIMARIDLTGSSTGWHRARLIQSAFEHFSEWWLAGTSYTRHWMPTGVPWSENHTDITNHYLANGVDAGFLAMALLIAAFVTGFVFVGRALRHQPPLHLDDQFLVWSLGSALFAHAITCLSIAYFDQSFVFLYLTMAAVGCLNSFSAAAGLSTEAEAGDSQLGPHAAAPAGQFDLAARDSLR